MIAPAIANTTAVTPSSPMLPHWAEIVKIEPEAPDVITLWLRFLEPNLCQNYVFRPGQFNMLMLPGLGEAAISISSDPADPSLVGHTVRLAGNVTQALGRLKAGDVLGVRGPFGSFWPIAEYAGSDVMIVAGGIGLPPLRTVIYHIIRLRKDFGRVHVLYGARTPQDLQFNREFEQWKAAGIELSVTVDRADDSWTGMVGVVPMMFYQTRMDGRNSVVMSCGPEIMLRFVIFEALARRVPTEKIFISMERNMKCGLGFCGHCQIGPYFVCKDGPVFSYAQLAPFYNVEEL